MELRIKPDVMPRQCNCYEIVLTFMFGDCEGSDKLLFYFTDLEYKNAEFAEEVHEFIKHLQSAELIDSNGRCGLEDNREVIDWYGFGFDRTGDRTTPVYRWFKYCENSVYENDGTLGLVDPFDENLQFTYSIPNTYDGWYASYDFFNISYYDEDGNTHNVEIIENNKN